MTKNIAAFFDIDGTIHRNSLLIEHFKMLVKYEYIDIIHRAYRNECHTEY